MTIRTVKLGGTDWVDGTVLDAADLNDTFDAASVYSNWAAYNTFINCINYTSSTGTWGVWNEQSHVALSAYLNCISQSIGDKIGFKVFLIPGTYKVVIGFRGASTGGIIDFNIGSTTEFSFTTNDASNRGKVYSDSFTTTENGLMDLSLELTEETHAGLSFVAISKTG